MLHVDVLAKLISIWEVECNKYKCILRLYDEIVVFKHLTTGFSVSIECVLDAPTNQKESAAFPAKMHDKKY